MTAGDGQPPSAPDVPATPEPESAHAGDLTAEWPTRAADAVDSVVAIVHDRAIRPVILGARGLVFGLVASTLGVLVTVLVSVGLVRLLDVYAFPGRVWASYALVGFVFAIVGLGLWTRRHPRRRA